MKGARVAMAVALACVLLTGCNTGTRDDPSKKTGSTAPGVTGPTKSIPGVAPVGTQATPGSTQPGAQPGTPAPRPGAGLAQFQFDPTITRAPNRWHLDFDAHGEVFHRNCVAHGLGVASEQSTAPINKLTRELVIQRCVERVNTAYLRNADGTGVPGTSFHVSFVALTPDPQQFPDGPGRDYSRICIGSSQSGCGSGTLGVETVDPGNRRAERACQLDRLGTFAGRICGLNSVLGRSRRSGGPLTTSDLKYVDGSYTLGSGTAAEDRRFQEIDDVITDWATAIGNVLAHEVGHSVGLDHTASGIMIGTTNARDLSDPNLPFSQSSQRVLARNLGIQP